MNTNFKNEGLSELSEEEYVTIAGGESAWYWVAYGAGAAYREAKEAVMHALVYVQTNIVTFSTI